MKSGNNVVIRTPDQRLRVFISSTLKELAAERGAARNAVSHLRLAPVMFELGARPHPASELYRAYLDQSHIFIGIYWQSYGWVAPDMEISGLEDEYRLAEDRPKLIYIKRPAPEQEPGLQNLLELIKSDDSVSYKYFANPEELQELIENDLALILTERFELSEAREETIPLDAAVVSHNLPAQLTSFIGREEETAAIRNLLLQDDIRLVTLTGPGGTGKTRLSLRVGRDLLNLFEDGVYFVSLGEILDPELVVSKVAQVLGIREGGSLTLQESLMGYLREKRMLLILDNFEHVLLAASAITDVLKAARGVKVLATSRISLNIQGEHEFQISPLDLPDPALAHEIDRLTTSEAIQMFIDRARAAYPRFALDEVNASTIIEICHRVDGLPLAIELAAARVKMLPPEKILDRLSSRLELLTGGPRDLPERQQALRNTLEWSVNLLDDETQAIFVRLGVFVGGFTLEAAKAVCTDGQESGDGLDIFDGIATLLDNSLLQPERKESVQPRFKMLETVREFAVDQLAAREDQENFQHRHARYYAQIMVEVAAKFYTREADYWLEWVSSEQDNLRATLTWILTDQTDIEFAPMLLSSMIWFWYRRGFLIEGREWCARVLKSPVVTENRTAKGLATFSSGAMAMWQGDLNTALSQIEEAVDIGRIEEDPFWIATGLLFQGTTLVNQGRDLEALPHLEEARALFEHLQLDWSRGATLVHMGNAALGLGNLEKAKAYLDEAQLISRELGENWLISFVLNNYGELSRVQGDYQNARSHYEESEALLRKMGDKGDLARLVHNLGYVALHMGDLGGAEEKLVESLGMFRKLTNQRGISECLAAFGGFWASRGEIREGVTVLGAAEALLTDTGATWWPADRVEIEWNVKNLKKSLGEEEFTEAWDTGQKMKLEEAIDFAIEGRL